MIVLYGILFVIFMTFGYFTAIAKSDTNKLACGFGFMVIGFLAFMMVNIFCSSATAFWSGLAIMIGLIVGAIFGIGSIVKNKKISSTRP